MKTTSRRDYLQRIYLRYRGIRNSEKGHILDEFCANCGYHRKYAIRLLNGAPPESKPVRRRRRRRRVSYGARLFRNLFLPSVKLVRKVRVGSHTRRIYGKPQTPFERVCASPASDPERIAALKRQQQELDPFELSRAIQTKMAHIFQLSQELAVRGKTHTAILQNGGERQIPKVKKKTTHKEERSRQKRGNMTPRESTKKPRRVASNVS